MNDLPGRPKCHLRANATIKRVDQHTGPNGSGYGMRAKTMLSGYACQDNVKLRATPRAQCSSARPNINSRSQLSVRHFKLTPRAANIAMPSSLAPGRLLLLLELCLAAPGKRTVKLSTVARKRTTNVKLTHCCGAHAHLTTKTYPLLRRASMRAPPPPAPGRPRAR